MSDCSEMSCANKEKLVADLKVVIADAEDILRATAGVAGEKMVELRERIAARLHDAKLRLEEAEALVIDKTKACAAAADEYVNENPWQAVGIAAGVGLLLGIIIARR